MYQKDCACFYSLGLWQGWNGIEKKWGFLPFTILQNYIQLLVLLFLVSWAAKTTQVLQLCRSIEPWSLTYYVWSLCIRRPVPSTDQAIPSCFYFIISWILMEQRCLCFFCPLGFLEGLRSLKQWLLQKVSMKNLDQKFKFLIKK